MHRPPETPRCPLCGRPPVTRFDRVLDPQSREAFRIVECAACCHAQTWPRPADVAVYYGAAYYGGRHGFAARHCVRRRLRRLTAAAGPGDGRRLLDVGCGDGQFLVHARARGWQVTGTELNTEMAEQAGLAVSRTLDGAAARGPFDCVTMWHSLEHFVEPLAELEAIGELLAPDGLLLVAVPDAQGLQARVFGPHWLHLDVPRHLHHFSRRSLELHLTRSGFVVSRVWHGEFEYDLLGWSQSALNRWFDGPNVLFDVLTRRDSKTGPRRRAAHVVSGTLLVFPALLPTWWGMLAGGAATLVVAARRDPEPGPRRHTTRVASGTLLE
ncbi:MAG TPA: class I SAM-dependent methyltransferase [Pirellulales bacterium]|nr:class I SAM-dependent methyltransferase [Pirellulales bacterium]